MQTIGERLEEARKRKGISLREAAEATKIRGDYLHKFESNQFEINLPEIYVRGFLRNYATLLKLSPEKITADYNALGLGGARASLRMPSREVYGRMDLSVASSPSASVENKASSSAGKPDSVPEPSPAPRRPVQNFRSSSPDSGPKISLDQALKIAGVIVLAVLATWGAVKLLSHATQSGKSAAVSAGGPIASPAPAEQPVTLADDTVTLVASGPVDVQVKDMDGKIIYAEHKLEAGQSVPIARHGAIFITYTIGKNLQIEVNGKTYPMPTPGYDRARID